MSSINPLDENIILHKPTGSYLLTYSTIEVVLDFVITTIGSHYVTPVFETSTQISLTILSFMCSLVLFFFNAFDLHDKGVRLHLQI
jgi:hypothetical protein